MRGLTTRMRSLIVIFLFLPSINSLFSAIAVPRKNEESITANYIGCNML